MDDSTSHDVSQAYLQCRECGRKYELASLAWRCDCGGLFDLAGFALSLPPLSALAGRRWDLWRYAEALPIRETEGISMGEGMTPLIDSTLPGVSFKLDYLMPSGSFKDRGAVMLATLAAQLGVKRLIVDSSGNAGTAIAAYAARAGIKCEVYVPASTSPGKLAQLHAYGAAIHQVPGTREDTAAVTATAADKPDVFYASQIYHPLFHHGTKTFVFELWEQYHGALPDIVVLPIGNGSLILGVYLGCKELLDAGLIAKPPQIIGVQAAGCAPLAHAFTAGQKVPTTIDNRKTIAEGIATARPPRGGHILAAIRELGGSIVTVTDDEIRRAHTHLVQTGLCVEPTSAASWAAITSDKIQLPTDATAVLSLGGTGLKTLATGVSSAV